jgi:hypothetical protein
MAVERFGGEAATLMALYGEAGPLLAIQHGRMRGCSAGRARAALLGSRFSDVVDKAENVFDVARQGIRNVRDAASMGPGGMVITDRNLPPTLPGMHLRRFWLPALTLGVLVLYGKLRSIERRRV